MTSTDKPHIDYGDNTEKLTPAFVKKLTAAFEDKCKLEAKLAQQQAALKKLNTVLLDKFGAGCALVVPGVCRVSLTTSNNVSISDPDGLHQVFGVKTEVYMDEVISYKPTAKLKALAIETSDEAEAIAEFVKVRTNQSARWLAAK